MIKLKAKYGILHVGNGTMITKSTPESVIKNLVKTNPRLKKYFDGLKTKENGKEEKIGNPESN